MLLLLPFTRTVPGYGSDSAQSSETAGGRLGARGAAADLAQSSEAAGARIGARDGAADLAQSNEGASGHVRGISTAPSWLADVDDLALGLSHRASCEASNAPAILVALAPSCAMLGDVSALVDSVHFTIGRFFNAAQSLYNPTTVTAIAIFTDARTGAKTRTAYTFGVDAGLTNPQTGVFVLAYPCSLPGTVEVSIVCPGGGADVKAVGESVFQILPRRVT